MHSLNLDSVLSPYTGDDFFKNYFGQNFLYVPGEPGKFGSIFNWSVVNHVLQTHRFAPPRLRLVQNGKPVPPDTFMRPGSAARATELTNLLRDGATLVVDAVDELYEPLTTLVERLEREFQVRIQVNMYAGWRVFHGFDVHWDGHDVLILQIAGRKQWKIYGETDRFPIKNSVELGKKPPTGDPVWEGFLTEGDVLYLPRGWWHVAIPCDEPTLHLTVGIHTPNGIDVVRWIADQLDADERMRQDVPVVAGAAAQAAYWTGVQAAIRKAFEAPDLLQRFIQNRHDMAPPRPAFGLPWSATPGVLPESEKYLIHLATPRTLEVRPGAENAIDVAFNGSVYTFAEAAQPLFRFLSDDLPASIADFYQRFATTFERETLQSFLIDLSKYGIIVLREPEWSTPNTVQTVSA
jgi:hypothetical protein